MCIVASSSQRSQQWVCVRETKVCAFVSYLCAHSEANPSGPQCKQTRENLVTPHYFDDDAPFNNDINDVNMRILCMDFRADSHICIKPVFCAVCLLYDNHLGSFTNRRCSLSPRCRCSAVYRVIRDKFRRHFI